MKCRDITSNFEIISEISGYFNVRRLHLECWVNIYYTGICFNCDVKLLEDGVNGAEKCSSNIRIYIFAYKIRIRWCFERILRQICTE
jgi:hypothetical protein